MDRKTIIILVCCVAGMLALNSLVNKLYPPIPVENPGTNSVAMVGGSNAAVNTATGAVTSVETVAASPVLPTFATNLEEQTLVITNDRTRLIFTSHGGGLKE